MATFEAQVEGLTSLSIDGSSAPTQTELTQFLTDGAKEIINILPDGLLSICCANQTFTSAAVGSEAEEVDTGKVLAVFAGNYEARRIPSNKKHKANDSNSIEFATATDPVYYFQNSKLNALPASTSCSYEEVQYPAVAYGDSVIASFPDEVEYLIPLYASIKSIQNAMGAKSSSLPDDLSVPVMETISTSLPSYTSPTAFVMPVAPSGVDIDFSEVGSIETFISPVFSAPTLGTIASISLPAVPVAPSMAEKSVTINGTAPTYISPVIPSFDFSSVIQALTAITLPSELVLPTLSFDSFPTITWSFPSAPIPPSSPNFSTPSIDGVIVSDMGTAPTYTAPKVTGDTQELTHTITAGAIGTTADFTNFEHWFDVLADMIETEEDIELASSQIQKISTYIGAYGQAMQNQLNIFNDANVEYQAKLEQGRQQAQINAQKAEQESNLILQKENQEYSASLQVFQNEISVYQANVSKIVQDNQAQIAEWQTESSQKTQKYSSRI